MSDVFKVVYEVPADLPAVTEHFAMVAAAASATWSYVESIGALGYHTSTWDGGLYGVIFGDIGASRAARWKVVDRVYHPDAERNSGYLCVPKKTKVAADVRAAFETVPAIPQSRTLAAALGWSKGRRDVTDGNKIYFAVVHKIDFPTPRVFVRAPRQIGDGFIPPDFWTERTEGDYMRAIEAHNSTVPPDV